MKTFLHRSIIHTVALAAPALLCTLPGSLRADEPLSITAQRLDEAAEAEVQGDPAARISAKFTTFAGSTDNATALVTGLHDGTAISLTSTTNGTKTTTQFQPATGKLDYHSTFVALELAQDSLAKAGITSPSPAQIQAALNGGSVTGSNGTAVTLTGVLTLRAQGDSWHQVAQALNLKTGHEMEGDPAARIGTKFTKFAGSSGNATALVTGLHDGTAITLTSTVNGQTTTTTFTPATGKLGYGNTFIALALAQGSLTKAGITSPTPAQIQAALNGGSVTGSNGTAVTLTGVLTMRATGEGWGDIAKTLDLKLGRISHDLRVAENGMEKENRQGDSPARTNGQSGDRGERVASTPKAETTTRSEGSGRAMSTPRPERVNLPDFTQVNRPGRH